MDRTIVKAGGIEVRLDGGGEGFRGSLATSTLESGVELVHLRIESGEAARPPVFRLSWSRPLVSVHGFWHPGAGYDKGLRVDWGKGVYSKATSGAPVGCLYDLEGRNRLTFALSDALNPATFHAGVHEESGEVNCWVRHFDEPLGPLGVYEAALRLDTRDLPYHEALSDVSRWWAHLPGYEPAGVPETARLPMYSTWYGFKLDFVDSFGTSRETGGGRDYDGVPEAVDRLLEDTIVRLRRIKPDVMVEFRQSYVGPLMRKYGNMFRAMDCPNDAVENRMHTLDIRLLCGDTATHSDMLMWHAEDPVHSAALQLVNVLFSVPQISVLLDRIPLEHVEMLRFWLGFWREHRDVFLDGALEPLNPEAIYPIVLARTESKLAAVAYGNAVVSLEGQVPATLLVVNGTLEKGVVLYVAEAAGARGIEVRDCRGRVTGTDNIGLETGLHRIDIPPGGVAVLK